MGNAREHPPIQITRTCPQPPGIERLREWCAMAGHWWTKQHQLDSRLLNESVLIFCVAGRGWVRVRQRRFDIEPGDLFLCPAGSEHGYGCDPETGWEIWWVHFLGAHATALCQSAGLAAACPVLRPEAPSTVVTHFSALLDALGRQENSTPWDAANHLHLLLAELVRKRRRQQESLVDLADASCESLAELVARTGMSKYHFCRRFREETGISPWQYVLERKTERARELLLGTSLSVKEIAAVLGFPHADYFARLFRRHSGVTPRAYRGA